MACSMRSLHQHVQLQLLPQSSQVNEGLHALRGPVWTIVSLKQHCAFAFTNTYCGQEVREIICMSHGRRRMELHRPVHDVQWPSSTIANMAPAQLVPYYTAPIVHTLR